ncbi:hypothetical protein AB0E27_31340 [Streptomyces sparsogenes]|uniref:hypothetical protein n=1 Tax=Streptomyces sparsogenes TaxID=67365 RepID=UPI0033C251A4
MNMQSILDKITAQNVQDIVDTAWCEGINYWAMMPTEEEKVHRPVDKQYTIVEGIDDYPYGGREVDAVHHLSRDDIRLAFAKLLDPDQEYCNERIRGYVLDAWRDRDEYGIDTAHIDADAADVIIQVAALDEVRYG